MKRRIGIWLIVVFVVTLFGIGGSFLLKSKSGIELNDNVLGVTNTKNFPHITSVPMQYLYRGELFQYFVEVSDLNTDIEGIDIYLIEKPQWMYIEGNEVRGLPLEEGTYKYVINVSDGKNSTTQVNYVLVLEDE